MRVSIFDPIKLEQGTVYVPSVTNDLLTRAMYDPTLQVSPSAFVCMKLPDWANTDYNEQTFYVAPEKFGTSSLIVDANVLVPGLLQNYWDNLSLYAKEQLVDINQTLAEQAWWKLLRSAFTFQPVIEGDSYVQQSSWDDFVTYIGTAVDLGSVELNGQAYTEAFLYIPQQAKRVKAHWKTTTPEGFETISKLPTGDFVENAIGLKPGDTTFVKAIYDIDSAGVENSAYQFTSGLDKLVIDFDNIETVEGDIEFNCIAIYCDVWSTEEPDKKTRCLHSLYFTNKFSDDAISGTYNMPTYVKKQMSDDGSATSMAFRVCTRVSSCNVAQHQIEVSGFDGVSLDMYMQALQQMANQQTAIERLGNKYVELKDTLDKLIVGMGINKNAADEVAALKKAIEQQGIYVAPNNLLDMFIEVSKAMKSSDKQVVVNINVQQQQN